MSTSRCVLTLVVTLACVGCDRTRGDSAASEQELPTTMKASNVGNPPLPVLWIEPFDLQTSVDEARMLIAIAHNAGEAPSEILGELENNIRLFRWPVMEPIPFATESQVRKGTHPQSVIHIVPKAKLSEGWYAIGITTAVKKLKGIGGLGLYTAPDGMRLSRFRVGAGLLLRSVYTAEKSNGSTVLYMEFSERTRINDVSGGSLRVENDYGRVACAEPAWKPHDDALRVSIRCATKLLGSGNPRIVIGDGISNETGLTLAAREIDLPAQTRTVDGTSTIGQAHGKGTLTKIEPLAWR